MEEITALLSRLVVAAESIEKSMKVVSGNEDDGGGIVVWLVAPNVQKALKPDNDRG